MAVNQKNFSYFTYVDDQGVTWNVRGEDGGAFSAVDGHTAATAGEPVFGRQTKRRHVRYVEATDPSTFRKARGIVYTAAAFAAISSGDTINVSVAGGGTVVPYNVSAKIAEKQPLNLTSRHLAEV